MSRRFWEIVCIGTPIWSLLFGICVVMLVFLGLSIYLSPPEPGTREIVVVNLVLIVPLMVALAATIRKCRLGDF